MGAVYKHKQSCCKMCKPHKRGIEPKRTSKERFLAKLAREEVEAILVKGWQYGLGSETSIGSDTLVLSKQ